MAAEIEALEQTAARAWPPMTLGALGGWRLHASSGFSGRANSCWPIGAPDRPLEAWYAALGLPALFKPVDGRASRPLSRALAARGYRPRTETLMMTGPLDAPDDGGASVSDQLDAGFCALFTSVQDDPADAAERIETLRRIAPPRAFASAAIEGRTAAIGAVAVEGDWAGVFAMRTASEHRRRGLARSVVGALFAAARRAGAKRAWLQVEADNAGAIRLYDGLGFREAYRYRYWDRP